MQESTASFANDDDEAAPILPDNPELLKSLGYARECSLGKDGVMFIFTLELRIREKQEDSSKDHRTKAKVMEGCRSAKDTEISAVWIRKTNVNNIGASAEKSPYDGICSPYMEHRYHPKKVYFEKIRSPDEDPDYRGLDIRLSSIGVSDPDTNLADYYREINQQQPEA